MGKNLSGPILAVPTTTTTTTTATTIIENNLSGPILAVPVDDFPVSGHRKRPWGWRVSADLVMQLMTMVMMITMKW